jgi:hypothetical protein
MFLVTMFCWDWAFIYPIKVFVVLLHEVGHGLAAVLTGGEIARIEISSNLGGVCWSRGGSMLAVLPAGYLGSMAFGGLILIGAAKTRHDQAISIAIGVIVGVITLLYVRNLFGIAFGLVFALAMIAAGKLLSEKVNDLLLRFIGMTSSLYAIIDIKEDLISRTVNGSDAFQMSKTFGLPPVFWGVLWIVVAIGCTAVFVAIAVEEDEAG